MRALLGARFHLSPGEVDRLTMWQFTALAERMNEERGERGG
jgi:hypothetical protein